MGVLTRRAGPERQCTLPDLKNLLTQPVLRLLRVGSYLATRQPVAFGIIGRNNGRLSRARGHSSKHSC